MPAKASKSSAPKVSHSGNRTYVFYPSNNSRNSNTNRQAQVTRTAKGTTCIYKK